MDVGIDLRPRPATWHIAHTAEHRWRLLAADGGPSLLLETDAPYLSPEPFRGQRVNEPALVRHVAQRLADLRGRPVEEIAEITTANAVRFFGLDLL